MVKAVIEKIDADFEDSVARLCELLRIPSIGTDPAYDPDTRRAGAWLAEQLAGLGFEARLCETPGQPIVLATYKSAGDSHRHLLYYGHYDVQPIDPVELWDHPPFEPTIVDGPDGRRVVARGAVDDKGQVMTWIEAFRAWMATKGELPFDITLFIEGEEEGASANLEPFMRKFSERLKADVCVISDTGMPGPDNHDALIHRLAPPENSLFIDRCLTGDQYRPDPVKRPQGMPDAAGSQMQADPAGIRTGSRGLSGSTFGPLEQPCPQQQKQHRHAPQYRQIGPDIGQA